MIWVKRGITILAFSIVLYFFWPLLGELRKTVDLFREAQWGWIVAAFLLQFASYANLTGLNRLLLRPFEGKISFWRMMAVLSSLAFIEVAIPSAGVSGVVLRARLLGKSGYSLEASMFTVFLEAIYISSVMIVVSLAGIWYLVQYGQVTTVSVGSLGRINGDRNMCRPARILDWKGSKPGKTLGA